MQFHEWETKSSARTLAVILLLTAVWAFPSAFADSTAVSYQGSLRNATGAPLPDGNYAITFSIWDAVTAGNQLWQEIQPSVAVKDGLFSVQLGSVTTLGTLFSTNSAVWLQVAADTGSGPEVYGPRLPLASAAYAKHADNAAAAVSATTGTNAVNAVNADAVDLKQASELAPPGVIVEFGGATAPSGWLLCNGAALSTTGTYANLFAAIGYTYGGSGVTFNLPNLAGKAGVGKDAGQAEFTNLGQTGGEKTHTLTVAEMPSHTHVQNAHNHIQDPHTHGATTSLVTWPASPNPGGWGKDWSNWESGGNYVTGASIANTTATNQPATATNQNTGGGGAHNNLQPYIVFSYIIKY